MKIKFVAHLRVGILTAAFLIPVVSAQNVGIGTTTPKSKLSVNGGTASGGIAIGDATYTSTTGTVAPLNGAIIQGSVGIGTTTPEQKMHVLDGNAYVSSSNGIGSVMLAANGGIDIYRGGPLTGTTKGYIDFKDNAVEDLDARIYYYQSDALGVDGLAFVSGDASDTVPQMFLQKDTGNVGIGTGIPVAPLHIVSSGGVTQRALGNVVNMSSLSASLELSTGNNTANLGGVGIYANGRIVSGSAVMAPFFQSAASFTASDRRIKDIAGVSDSTQDLEILKKLRVTDYTMKDPSLLGDKSFKKVIAQEVEAVFPQAVSKTVKSIPDVMQSAKVEKVSDTAFRLPLAKATVLKEGEFVEIFDKDKTPQVLPISKVDGNAITLALKGVKEGEEVFVYGRQVNDFGIVDYEALSMLNISATQELAKKVAALGFENAELKEQVAGLKTANEKLTAIAAEMEGLKQAVTAIRLQNETTARTVSITR